MEELRVVRREEESLIVASDSGVEYRLIVDDTLLSEFKHFTRRGRDTPRVSPREIQALVRAGKNREEIAEITGAAEADIERYEEPVLAERRFILSSAQAVPVRTSPNEDAEEKFGEVIAERLISLGASEIAWRSWKDEDAGWMIGLDFFSYEVAHHAVWSFEHRKSILSPLSPDAVTLSQQGEVGDRLIPKLRAVDAQPARERFDSGAFDPESLTAGLADGIEAAGEETADPSASDDDARADGHQAVVDTLPIVDPGAEFARRREIDQRAINSPEPELPDLGQTADLLDALRRRRGEREAATESSLPVSPFQPSEVLPRADEQPVQGASTPLADEPERSVTQPSGSGEKGRRVKGRASIPSWDDILFGTRSEEDPL